MRPTTGWVAWAAAMVVASWMGGLAWGQGRERVGPEGPMAGLSLVLGRPTDRSVTLSVLSATAREARLEYGVLGGAMTGKVEARTLRAGEPSEFELSGLEADRAYAYRLRMRSAVGEDRVEEGTFRTQRSKGSTFRFALQGDSHPERLGKMYDPRLYERTMRNVATDGPDFYLTMGDDFSIERLIARQGCTEESVGAVYAHQRGFLGVVGRSAALYLVNGNHEEAARYLCDGTATNPAVLAGRSRVRFFPLPAPDFFYTGNIEPVEHVGLVRDYYAWTWGDALFVVIDPYWHSAVQVDAEAGGKQGGGEKRAGKGGKGGRDLWGVTLGDVQYHWLERTLRGSDAKFKFVFCHHVLGTGRGGIEEAGRFEWGGSDSRGFDRFFQNRPGWTEPIHALMRDSGVTIFFQAHDHLYAHQELEGVVYQSVPNPADSTFTAFNREAYRSGDVLPNSGHLRVTVTEDSACVEYVRSRRPEDEGEENRNGTVARGYSVMPREARPGPR